MTSVVCPGKLDALFPGVGVSPEPGPQAVFTLRQEGDLRLCNKHVIQLPGYEPCLSFPTCEVDGPWHVLVPPVHFSHGWRVEGWAKEAGPPPGLTRLRRPSIHEPEDHCHSVTRSTSFFQTSLSSERPTLHTHSDGFAGQACKS